MKEFSFAVLAAKKETAKLEKLIDGVKRKSLQNHRRTYTFNFEHGREC